MVITDNQFGFKCGHGTDQCVYILKDFSNLYTSRKGCVFTCFLDSFKALDGLNHSLLFNKLHNRGDLGYIWRMLAFWYQNQTMCIEWGSALSETFTVTNGVRQDSISYLHFSKVYINDLSMQLNKTNIIWLQP